MAEIIEYDTENEFIIEVKLDEQDDRVCDYCNKLLASYDEKQKKLVCNENCFSTAYGLLCGNCKGSIEALKSYRKDEEYKEYKPEPEPQHKYRHAIQKFRSKRSNEIYEVIFTEKGLSCNCKGWIFRRQCKHINYVMQNLDARDKQGKIVNFVSEITDIPSYQGAKAMDFGRNKEMAEKWHIEHLKIIEL